MSSVLTRLELSIEQEELTVDMSATLCQLTRLQKLGLSADMDTYRDTKNSKATLTLSLPRLEELKIISIALELMCLRCPKLRELVLEEVALEDFDGMPDSIQKLRLDLDDSVDLEVIVPAHSARMLEELLLLGIEGSDFSKPAAVQDLCLNGRLKCLRMTHASFHAGAFSVGAIWHAVPQTLQDVTLALPLNVGIPTILEQLPSLRTLSLTHSKCNHMHLDRPLDPFLDMPRLEMLELHSDWSGDLVDDEGNPIVDTGMCRWTPLALRFLGLAEKRIKQMQRASPGRSMTLSY